MCKGAEERAGTKGSGSRAPGRGAGEVGTLTSECPPGLCHNLACAPACPSAPGRHPSLLREPQVLLQPHHLVSHQTPLALLWAQGASSLPFAFLGAAEVPFLPTQSRNLPPSGLYLLPSGQVPTRGWRWGWGGKHGPGSRGRRVGEERGGHRCPCSRPTLFPGTR